mmetsp:Transcript_46683/g.92903  ORF Transcript_46683/g.92903 Transcript_46683/m.92903 type:complete len:203 (+) Transcript_46683:535-1143(+)
MDCTGRRSGQVPNSRRQVIKHRSPTPNPQREAQWPARLLMKLGKRTCWNGSAGTAAPRTLIVREYVPHQKLQKLKRSIATLKHLHIMARILHSIQLKPSLLLTSLCPAPRRKFKVLQLLKRHPQEGTRQILKWMRRIRLVKPNQLQTPLCPAPKWKSKLLQLLKRHPQAGTRRILKWMRHIHLVDFLMPSVTRMDRPILHPA